MTHEARPMEKVVVEKQILKEICKYDNCLHKYDTGEWPMNEANYAEFKRRIEHFEQELEMLRKYNLICE